MVPFSRRNVLLALLAAAIVLPLFANFYHLFIATLYLARPTEPVEYKQQHKTLL